MKPLTRTFVLALSVMGCGNFEVSRASAPDADAASPPSASDAGDAATPSPETADATDGAAALTTCGWPEGENCRANFATGYFGSCCAAHPTCVSRLGAEGDAQVGKQPWNYYMSPATTYCQ